MCGVHPCLSAFLVVLFLLFFLAILLSFLPETMLRNVETSSILRMGWNLVRKVIGNGWDLNFVSAAGTIAIYFY